MNFKRYLAEAPGGWKTVKRLHGLVFGVNDLKIDDTTESGSYPDESFYCSDRNKRTKVIFDLTTLEGLPRDVYSLDIIGNKLTNLDHAPINVHHAFAADHNKLTSLANGPRTVANRYSVCSNELTDLVGAPAKTNTFDASNNKLTTMRGAPLRVDGDFNVYGNHISSLEFAPAYVDGFVWLTNNKLTSLHNIHKHFKYISDLIWFSGNPIKEAILGLILIDGLNDIDLDNITPGPLYDACRIVRKYIGKGMEGVSRCQDELIEAGLDDFAEL